jgi:hypothetical protein
VLPVLYLYLYFVRVGLRHPEAEEKLQKASKCFAVCPTSFEDTDSPIKAVLVTQTIVEARGDKTFVNSMIEQP